MDACAVEVGLLKKHPCAGNAIAKCANCEMALCAKHAVPQLSATKQRTGKFMCAECDKATKAADKAMARAPQHAAPKAAPKPAGSTPPVTPAKAGAAQAGAQSPPKKDSADEALEFKPTKK